MTLNPGKKLSNYEIVALLGSGGMGEVYRAKDLKLKREVAIKIAPDHFARDGGRVVRFRREAEALAALNHPAIAAIYGFEEDGESKFLVLELVEGETLADRLARGPIPIGEVVPIARQIAEALAAAHEKGVVHRDLKPANIKLTPNGDAKVLDFGLAKMLADTTDATTAATNLTASMPGTVMGTAGYMSPEQARGSSVDERTDIFAFGCVLFEMLTGRRAFEGDSVAEIMGRTITVEPDLSRLPSETPEALRRLLRRALKKDPRRRLSDIHDACLELEEVDTDTTVAAQSVRSSSQKKTWIIAGVVVALLAVMSFTFLRRNLPVSTKAMRLTVMMPPTVALAVGENSPASAVISPDGTQMVLRGVDSQSGKVRLYVRAVNSVDLVPLPGTEDASSPFWSADSNSIGFFSHSKLMRTPAGGGTPRVICDAFTSSGSGAWSKSDVIIASLMESGPLFSVPADGGVPVPVTSLKAPGELSHDWPQFLPDGKHFLYLSSAPAGAESAIYAATLGSTDTKLVLKGISSLAVYAAPGHLVFMLRGTLVAQPFDVEKLELTGSPTPLAENVLPPFSASENEIITYRNRVQTPDRFVWVGWDGREIGPVLPPGYYADPALSPDGSKLAFAKRESPGAALDIWILEFATGALNKFTTDPADDRTPVWSPDGKSIVFWSQRSNAPGLYRKEASGIGAEEVLLQTKDLVWPYQWTNAGLLYFGGPSVPTFDIYLYSFADRKTTPVIHTMSIDADGAVSPDGKWLAYEDNHTGRYEVYVTTFPASSTRLSVTNESGVDSLWSSDGRKLFYVNSTTLELLSADVKPGNPPEFGPHHRIHPGPLDWTSGHSFDIDTKRQRVLVQVPTAQQTDITVLLNWRSVPKK
jgi:serine/threonine protein kinase